MQAKRSLLCTYLRTNDMDQTTPTWSLIGDGFTSNSISYEPDSDDLQYINEDSSRTVLKRYKPTMNLEGVIEMDKAASAASTSYTLNPVFEYINNLRRKREVTGNESEILIVELYTGKLDEVNNVWENCSSQRQKVNIQLDEFGGEAGETISFSATINFSGDPSDSVSKYSVVNTSKRTLITDDNTKTVTYTLTNLGHANQPTKAFVGIDFNATITANDGYHLPTSLTSVSVGGESLTSDDYTWNAATGRIHIDGAKVTGAIVITATGAANS